MGYLLDNTRLNEVIGEMSKKYRFFAPKRVKNRGKEAVRYGEISSLDEIVLDVKSEFSPKEIISPIVQTLLHFDGGNCTVSEADDREIILLARPCDLNGINRLDTIYLENGGNFDYYYKRVRDRLHLFLLECSSGWESCFCASMGANHFDDYELALRIEDDKAMVQVKNPSFEACFSKAEHCEFAPEFVEQNEKTIRVPDIKREELPAIHKLPMWTEYDNWCIGCGSCNTVCGTCSCFDTVDTIYDEKSRNGERRRTWACCMQEDFTATAGGHKQRAMAGQRMRFKVLHKVYDYNRRFGKGNMCVGCGRCDLRCPKGISYSDAVNRLATELEGVRGK